MSSRYVVSPEEIRRARYVDLLSFLQQRGYQLVKDGKYYRLKEHDSIVIDPTRNKWYWNSQGLKNANTVDFLTVYEHLSLPEAVTVLLGQTPPPEPVHTEASKAPTVFTMPPANTDARRLIAYLCKTRGLRAAEVVLPLLRSGLIYEDDRHNVVFVTRDEHGDPIGYFRRGTGSTPFKSEGGTDKAATFLLTGGDCTTLYVTESAIDVLSVEDLRQHVGLPPRVAPILSLAGNQINALAHYVDRHGDVLDQIIVCTDNDNGGNVAYTAIFDAYAARYTVVRALPPTGCKDWNDAVVNERFAPAELQALNPYFDIKGEENL